MWMHHGIGVIEHELVVFPATTSNKLRIFAMEFTSDFTSRIFLDALMLSRVHTRHQVVLEDVPEIEAAYLHRLDAAAHTASALPACVFAGMNMTP